MKRRKWLLGLLLLCAIPFALSHASAKELITHFEVPQIRLYAASRGSNCLSVTSTGSSVVDKSRTYTIKSTNPDVKKIEVIVGLMDNSYESSSIADTLYHPDYIEMELNADGVPTCQFTYTFRIAETHAILFYPLDANGQLIEGGTFSFTFEVSKNSASDILGASIERALATLDTSDDYTAALSIHNWIVDRCTYDNSHTYYSPYDLIVDRRGTCNSYARAFDLMMRAAGYSAHRVLGWGNGESHAWNLALLDGAWYQLDPTWDDTGSTMSYFAITDALMSLDHVTRSIAGGVDGIACTSLDCNYYLRSGAWQTCAVTILDALQQQIDSGQTALSTPLATTAGSDFRLMSDRNVKVFNEIFVRAIPQVIWYHSASKTPVQASVTYDTDSRIFSGTYIREQVLTLPNSLKEIEAEAFSGLTARYVDIPAGCAAIGSRAFADTLLWGVKLPAGVTEIASDAFTDSPYLRLLAPASSDTAALLQRMGLHYASY